MSLLSSLRSSSSSNEQDGDSVQVQVLLPSTMQINRSGQLVLSQSLNIGSVVLLEEGEPKEVRVEKRALQRIGKEVFGGKEVGII